MVNSKSSKKIIKHFISLIAVIVMVFALAVSANAESYRAVKLNIPRISQRPNTGDCAIASMSTVEAYFHGLPSGNYNSTAYQAVYSANGYSIGANWSAIGYKTIEYFSMQEAYNQLKTGTPIIVHRTSNHYSVVYGYDGSTSSLQLSGFMIVDVDDSYNNSSSAYMRLDRWKGGYSLDRMVVRVDGLTIKTGALKINGNHPAAYHEKGSSFTPHGKVISNYNITGVSVAIKSSAGNNIYSYSAAPNATSFALSKASSNIKVANLDTGNYTYYVYAKDSSGAQKTYSYSFKVVSGSYVPADDVTPQIKTVSYKAVVTADPCLNMRKGTGINYDIITTISKNEIVDVTAECNGWATVKYKGYVGWVSMDYLTKYVEPVIETKPVIQTDGKVKYGRITSKINLKKSASTSASNVVSISKNSIVTILNKEDNWLKVSFNGKNGYIQSKNCVSNVFDVDKNGTVNSVDALSVLESSVNKSSLTSAQKKRADADGNGKVNSSDSLLILQVSTGKKTF